MLLKLQSYRKKKDYRYIEENTGAHLFYLIISVMFQHFMQPQRNTLSKAINEDQNQDKEIEHTQSETGCRGRYNK